MENYRKTQQLYKLLGLFKKTHKKQPILDIFNFMIFTPKSIQHLAIQNIMTLIASFLLGIFIGVIIVKFQTYKYTYWTELLKLTIQLMEHEKKYKAIQTSNNIDSSNSRNWKKKIITWLQN